MGNAWDVLKIVPGTISACPRVELPNMEIVPGTIIGVPGTVVVFRVDYDGFGRGSGFAAQLERGIVRAMNVKPAKSVLRRYHAGQSWDFGN